MLNKEGTLYKVSIEYNRLITEKLDKLKLELDTNRRNINMFSNLIVKYSNDVTVNSVLSWLIKEREFKSPYRYDKKFIDNLFKNIILTYKSDYNSNINSKNSKTLHLVSDYYNDNSKVIVNYYVNYRKFCILEHTILTRIEKFKRLHIKEITARYLFKTMFMYIAFEMFKTNQYFNLPFNINIRITGKMRKSTSNRIKVDYGKSFETLKAIAKEDNVKLYNRYINGEIKRSEFRELMKPFVYSNDNSTGKKWIVNDNKEFDFWLTIWTRYSELRGIENYNIIPANFIHPSKTRLKSRTHAAVIAVVDGITGVIETDLLGFRDKLKILEKNHLSYCLNIFTHNIEI